MNSGRLWRYSLPLTALAAGLVVLTVWWLHHPREAIELRAPGTDHAPAASAAGGADPGRCGPGGQRQESAGKDSGAWTQFRGPNRDGISPVRVNPWASNGPQKLWSIACGDGFAGAAVQDGRVYLMDYDADKQECALRCLSLDNGAECWRYAYPVVVKANQGMTRTVPALAWKSLVAIDARCNVLCVDAYTGALRWRIDLVREYGATIPPWYTGQCPLIDGNTVLVAPGGPDALLLAVDLDTGQPLWRTPNPHGWKMTHSSIMAVDCGGEPGWAYCASGGVIGVAAKNGSNCWETADWKISFANVPSPVALGGGKVFLSGGYHAGSELVQLLKQSTVNSRPRSGSNFPRKYSARRSRPRFFSRTISSAPGPMASLCAWI